MMRLDIAILVAALIAVSGCQEDLTPASKLQGVRTLALIADPIEVGPGIDTRIAPFIFSDTSTATVKHDWTSCPITAGPNGAYACVVPVCEAPVTSNAAGVIVVQPFRTLIECVERLAAGGDIPDGAPTDMADIPENVEALFTHRATAADGEVRTSIARIKVWTMGPPPKPNRSPRLSSIRLGDTTVTSSSAAITVPSLAKIEVEVTIDASSLDDDEVPYVSLYATSGKFTASILDGLTADTELELEDKDGTPMSNTIYAVVRDGRGGQAVYGPYTLTAP